jgi:hypothetical protein
MPWSSGSAADTTVGLLKSGGECIVREAVRGCEKVGDSLGG